ncbi:MAG: TRAP transporter substrate-binding protein [Deltaproteobacteria bacterium]|nr:TRAP transporter substrate-binding protein [Candidatus Desulfobacula maris]
MFKKISVFSIVMLILSFSITGMVAAKTLKMGAVTGAEANISKAAKHFINLVEERTNGSVKIEYFPGSMLGKAATQLESLRMGELDFFVGGVGWFSQLVGEFNLWATAFVMKDYNHAKAAMDGEPGKIAQGKLLDKYKIRMLDGTWYRAPRQIFSTKKAGPIKSINDLKGVIMRTVPLDAFAIPWGATPATTVSIPYSELYMALQQGVAEAFEGPIDLTVHNKMHEPCKYVSLTSHQFETAGIVISEMTYQGLTKEEQNIITKSAIDTRSFIEELIKSDVEKQLADLREKGQLEIIEDVDRDSFFKALSQVPYKMEAKGIWEKGLYDKVMKIPN